MAEESVKKQTLSSVKWTAIERFGLQGMQFFLGLIMARLLSPVDYGTVGMIAIFLAISQSFIDSGFGNALVRKLDRTETDFSTVFYFNNVMALLCYGLLFVIAPWVADFFNTPILCAILRVQSINILLNALMQIQVAKLTIKLDFKALAKRSIISTSVSGVVGVIMAYNGFGVWALVYQSIINTAIKLVFIWIYCKWLPKRKFSWNSFRELGSYGSKLLASGLLHTIYTNLTTLIIGRYFSAKDLGYYNRGTHFATMPVSTINGILQQATFPILSTLQNDDKRLISVYRKYICITSIPIFIGCMLLVGIGKPLILFLLTDKWIEAVPYLWIFAFAIIFNHICTINLNLLQVKGRSDLFLKLEIIKKTISIAILFASIPFGVIGICISKVIYTQIAVYINTYYTGKLFSLGYWTQVKDFGKYLIVSILACLPAFFVSLLDIHPIISLLFGCLVSPVLYWLMLCRDKYFIELTSLAIGEFHNMNRIFKR